jgi:hypothetical protein
VLPSHRFAFIDPDKLRHLDPLADGRALLNEAKQRRA